MKLEIIIFPRYRGINYVVVRDAVTNEVVLEEMLDGVYYSYTISPDSMKKIDEALRKKEDDNHV